MSEPRELSEKEDSIVEFYHWLQLGYPAAIAYEKTTGRKPDISFTKIQGYIDELQKEKTK